MKVLLENERQRIPSLHSTSDLFQFAVSPREELSLPSGAPVFVIVMQGMPLDGLTLVASGSQVPWDYNNWKDNFWQTIIPKALNRQ